MVGCAVEALRSRQTCYPHVYPLPTSCRLPPPLLCPPLPHPQPLVYMNGCLKNVSNDASNQRALVKLGALHVLAALCNQLAEQVGAGVCMALMMHGCMCLQCGGKVARTVEGSCAQRWALCSRLAERVAGACG